MKTLTLSALVCAALAWPLASQAQEDPMTAKYRLFLSAQMADDKCHTMSFADRDMVNDIALATMTQLPAVLAEDPGDFEAYFGAVGDATEPIHAELETAIAQVPCDRAAMLTGSVAMQGYAELLAFLRIAGEPKFQELATPQQMEMAQILVNYIRQAAGANAGQLEQLIQMRQAELAEDYTPEQAANMVRHRMNLMNINRAVQARGHDLRWNAEEEGWGLWNPQENRFKRGLVFDDPGYTHAFSVIEGENVWANRVVAHDVIVLPGREYSSTLTIMVIDADPQSPGPPTQARISYGQDWASYRSFETGRDTSDCPMDACFTYVGDDLRKIRNAAEAGSVSTPQLILYQDHDYLTDMGGETMRERTGLDYREIFYVHADRIFPDEEE